MKEQQLTLDTILNLFEKKDAIWNDLLNIRISGTWITMINTTINNKPYKYNQNYTLVVDRGDIFINNWNLLGEDKYYDFQDRYTYKNLKSAIKNLIKLNKKGIK